jgi:ABC-2 type transport system permease protein
MNLVTRKLIAKEVHVNRWLIVAAVVSILVSLGIAATGRVGFNIGSITWITGIVAFGVIMAFYGVTNERKENSLQFVLSLPLGPRDYLLAKVLGLLLCYLGVWVVATAGAVALVLFSDVPDGMLPYTVLLAVFLLTNFSLVLCCALHARTEGAMNAVIVATNLFVTLYMFGVATVPGLTSHMYGPVAVWNGTAFAILAIELCALALTLSLPFLVAARRRDFL